MHDPKTLDFSVRDGKMTIDIENDSGKAQATLLMDEFVERVEPFVLDFKAGKYR